MIRWSNKLIIVSRLKDQGLLINTDAAALVVIVRSTATGARVGSTVDVCVIQGSRSIVPPPF